MLFLEVKGGKSKFTAKDRKVLYRVFVLYCSVLLTEKNGAVAKWLSTRQ